MREPLFKEKKRKKKGAFSPAIFVTLAVVIFIMAPVMIKVIVSSTTGLYNAVNQSDPYAIEPAQTAVDKVVGFIDYIIIIGLVLNIILLFLSAYFIDTSPIFLLLYILSAFVFVLLLPNLLNVVDTVYAQFATEATELPLVNFLRTNMMAFVLVIIFLTGVIMYAKFRSVSTQYG